MIPAVRFSGITRRFPGVAALTDVAFDIAAGSCHAICGENGAGKSTLGRILAGVDQADSGSVELNGTPVRFSGRRDAMAAGIAIVHQEPALCPNLSVAENLCLSRLPRRGAFVDRGALAARAAALLEGVAPEIDPARAVSSLSVAEQQLVQIAAAVDAEARVIVFDEPTSSLGEREAARLYDVIGTLRERGTTVIYVSHRMQEIFRLCDHVTVLRDGAHVVTSAAGDLDEGRLVELMIGRRLEPFRRDHATGATGSAAASTRSPRAAVLELEQFAAAGFVRDVSFTLFAGEILGVAGLVGAGRSEIARALFGLDPRAAGTVRVRGREVRIRSPNDAMALGIGFVPEDRKRLGLVLAMRNRENGSLSSLSRYSRSGWISRHAEREGVRAAFSRVRMGASPEVRTGTLSGGNQQKVVIAKWLAGASSLLILDEPTRGVDVGAKAELHGWIDGHVAGGGAALLITSDMPELLRLATRILVLRAGRLVGELSRAEATQEGVLRLMTGTTDATGLRA